MFLWNELNFRHVDARNIIVYILKKLSGSRAFYFVQIFEKKKSEFNTLLFFTAIDCQRVKLFSESVLMNRGKKCLLK